MNNNTIIMFVQVKKILATISNIEILTDAELNDICYLCCNLTSEYDESHDYNHHIVVFENAARILNKYLEIENNNTNVDRLIKIITYVTLLHDTIDHKYPNNIQNKIEKLNLLLQTLVPTEFDNIKWIIDNISFSKEVKNGRPKHLNPIILLARDICSDADKIDAIGLNGLKRCWQYTKGKNKNLSIVEIKQKVIEHCHEKLLLLKDYYIHTSFGKELAAHGHQIILDFVQGKINLCF